MAHLKDRASQISIRLSVHDSIFIMSGLPSTTRSTAGVQLRQHVVMSYIGSSSFSHTGMRWGGWMSIRGGWKSIRGEIEEHERGEMKEY